MRRRLRRLGAERGTVSLAAVLLTAAFILLAGLCLEGGRALNARATLADAAEQAARAGAQQLSFERTRSGGAPTLDPTAARSAALHYLADNSIDGTATVIVQGDTISVTIHDDAPTALLSAVGISSIPITVDGTATTVQGITEGQP
ncbi:Uncharacterised protein [Actinomyces denticolens]|uniref:TadE/TadG family type IV pilus assembly protein n=1 Tax=Actinomyces TaxID=1654 RepID=UPI000E1A4234|nr:MULTISPECIES: TadE/TadG family type IV pilus assembly protein [Actinomyces]SUU13752.1 Uncharacterised protein [Actinomyces denticolens]